MARDHRAAITEASAVKNWPAMETAADKGRSPGEATAEASTVETTSMKAATMETTAAAVKTSATVRAAHLCDQRNRRLLRDRCAGGADQ